MSQSNTTTHYNINISNNEIKKYNCELRTISIKTIKMIFNILIERLDKDAFDYNDEKTKLENKQNIYINKYHKLSKNE